MSKIIIQNNANISDELALRYISKIIEIGRISNNATQYCYHTSFESGIEISSFLNKKSDRFIIYKVKNSQHKVVHFFPEG